MTARATAMPTTRETPRPPHRAILPRWPGVVFAIVILAAIGFAIAHRVNRMILPAALMLATTAGLGLISGFAVRRALRHRARLLQTLASFVALSVGLLTLGLITQGQAGIGPLDPARTGPDWRGLGQMALAAAANCLALWAWQPKLARPSRADRWQALRTRIRERWEASALERGLGRVRDWWGQTRARLGSIQLPTASSPLPRARVRLDTTPRSESKWNVFARFREWLGRRKASLDESAQIANDRSAVHIRFTGWEEHRCPYCLELVERGGLRGVEVCPICHTWHHADCWAVTGVCQVPHHHTEMP